MPSRQNQVAGAAEKILAAVVVEWIRNPDRRKQGPVDGNKSLPLRAAVEDRREFQQRRAAGQTPLRGNQGDGARHLHADLADIDEGKTNTPEACR